MPLNLKDKIQLELNEVDLKKLVQEAVAKELDKTPDEIIVNFEIKRSLEGNHWDPYEVTRVHAKVNLR